MSVDGWVALAGLALSAFNIYITMSIRLAIEKNKSWVKDNFVSKDDMELYLAPIREKIQVQASDLREDIAAVARRR